MREILLPLSAVILGVLAAVACERLAYRYVRYLGRRTRDWTKAIDALERHRAALHAVFARKDVDDSLKRMLLEHSELGLDERYTLLLLDQLLRSDAVEVPEGETPKDEAMLRLEALEATNPKAYAAVEDVLRTLINAMVLSSPATVRRATDALELVSKRPDRVVRAATRPMRIPHMVEA